MPAQALPTGQCGEYFGASREYWWNDDFLRLMARRWDLGGRVRRVLDAGCGLGHWGQLLTQVLREDCYVVGVDSDPLWPPAAAVRAEERGLADQCQYLCADVASLPFPSDTFDVVTCQTVLIHIGDVEAALAEMIRVTRTGGLVAVAEPNNLSGALLSEAALVDPLADVLDRVRLQATCERGKAALGEGENSVGERLPGLFGRYGLSDLQVFLNDKTSALTSPYSGAEKRLLASEMVEQAEGGFFIWRRPDASRYFLAGGGTPEEFERLWSLALRHLRDSAAAVEAGTYASAGGAVVYLVSGRKVAAS